MKRVALVLITASLAACFGPVEDRSHTSELRPGGGGAPSGGGPAGGGPTGGGPSGGGGPAGGGPTGGGSSGGGGPTGGGPSGGGAAGGGPSGGGATGGGAGSVVRYFTLGSGTHLNPRAIAYQGLIRVFAYNPTTGDLEWCDSAPSCQWQPLDGSGGMNGRTTGDVGAECISAEVWDDELYVVHRQDDFAGSRRVIRVGLLKNGVWTFQTVDGHGFNGHGTTGQDVGGCPSMAAAPPWVFIGYSELASSAFRIGWSNRLSWDFQTNDGVGGANGRVQAPLSRYSTLITFNAVLHAFYSTTNGSLRVGEFTGLGADWTFSAAIPQAQPLDSAPFALVHDGKLSVFYRDGSLLRAATKPTYAPLVIDGDGLGGRGANDVGQYGGGAVFSGNTAHAFFYDATAGDLRHAQLTFGTWSVDTLDGDANEPDGRIDAEVGKSASAVRTSSGVAAVYEGPSESVRMVLIE